MNGADDKELARLCREGDARAWEAIVGRFGRRVYGIAYHFTLRREEAEELSQEIFLKVFENITRYDGNFPMGAWIVSVARNLCIDQYRRRKREKAFVHVSGDAVAPLLIDSDDPARKASDSERARLLFEAIAELPDDLAEILVLRDLDGFAYEEIGTALELPEGTVKSRLFRARAETAKIVREKLERKERRSGFAPAALALAMAAVAR
jgi:RNA polymerase sigma-70 factor (ECF subfamily)